MIKGHVSFANKPSIVELLFVPHIYHAKGRRGILMQFLITQAGTATVY